MIPTHLSIKSLKLMNFLNLFPSNTTELGPTLFITMNNAVIKLSGLYSDVSYAIFRLIVIVRNVKLRFHILRGTTVNASLKSFVKSVKVISLLVRITDFQKIRT